MHFLTRLQSGTTLSIASETTGATPIDNISYHEINFSNNNYDHEGRILNQNTNLNNKRGDTSSMTLTRTVVFYHISTNHNSIDANDVFEYETSAQRLE